MKFWSRLSFDKFEKRIKKSKALAIPLSLLFVLGLLSSATGFFKDGKAWIQDYFDENKVKKIVTVEADSFTERMLRWAKAESHNYNTPSSTTAIVKFLSRPDLLSFRDKSLLSGLPTSFSLATSVSPLSASDSDLVFDGADCRFALEAIPRLQKISTVSIQITGISCTDNLNNAYEFAPGHSIGFISDIDAPGKKEIKVHEKDNYFSVNHESNYIATLYEPLENFHPIGKSFFGRF